MRARQGLVASVILCLVFSGAAHTAELDEAALADLCRSLLDNDLGRQGQALAHLVEMGDAGVRALLDALSGPSSGYKACAQTWLRRLATHYAEADAPKARRASFLRQLSEYLAGDAPDASKTAVIEVLRTYGGKDVVPAIAACLQRPGLTGAAGLALARLPCPEALEALRDALSKAQGPSRISIIGALADRRDPPCPQILVAELGAATDADVRIAVLNALQKIGDPQTAPALVAALDQGSKAERAAAYEACSQLARQLAKAGQGPEALRLYVACLRVARTPAERRWMLLQVSDLGTAAEVADVVACLADPDPTVQNAARDCLAKMGDAKVTGALAEAARKAPAGQKMGLLRVVQARGGAEATEAIEAAAKDGDPELRLAALRLLGRISGPEGEEALLATVQADSGPGGEAAAAEAYLQLGDERWKVAAQAPQDAYARALELASTDELRARALTALAAATRAAAPSQGHPRTDQATHDAGLNAYVDVASRAADCGELERARAMLHRALGMDPTRETALRAITKLRELGEDFDPAHEAGFVTVWWVIGPFPGGDIGQVRSPEWGVDLPAGVDGLKWAKHHCPDPTGIVDLNVLLHTDQKMTAYLYAEVTVDHEQAVLLKTGCDDTAKIWLNRSLIYTQPHYRSLLVDQDTVKAQLATGPNKILVKVANWSLGWLVCLRITDPDGMPLQFTQKDD